MAERKRELLTEVLGYQVTTSVIGKGSYSKVVYGIDRDTRKRVAVKMVDLKYHRNYYERELAALSSLHPHKNVVHLLAHHEDWTNEIGYLIEEYVRANTLEEYVRQKSQRMGLKEKEALAIFEQIVDAVHHVHLASFTHHDLKPDNVLYDPLTERIRLIDFGLAQRMDEDDMVEHCAGSPLYMAPEVIHNLGSHDAIKSDVWSLAIVLFYLLVGDTPYLAVDTVEELIAIIDARRFYLPRFLSTDILSLLQQMMQPHASQRPSVPEVLESVRQLRRKSGHHVVPNLPEISSFAMAASQA